MPYAANIDFDFLYVIGPYSIPHLLGLVSMYY